jgi:Na+-driven multidrug efflux pump
MMFFPGVLLSLFSNDSKLIASGIIPLRIIVMLFPTLGITIIGGSFFQAIGKALPATIITVSRQLLFLLPAIFILPLFFDLNGVWLSWPVSDFLAFLVTGIFVLREISIINKSLEAEACSIA